MARFFQHIEPGKNLGKITRLKYIDDVSDDELVLYVFEDGSKCSSEFISSYGEDSDPFEAKKIMVEVSSPTNAYAFTKKEVRVKNVQKLQGDDGNIYEVPSPDVTFDGAGGQQERTVKEFKQDGIRTEVTKRPKPNSKFVPETDENYLLSLHSELESGQAPVVQQAVRNAPRSAVSQSVENIVQDTSVQQQAPVQKLQSQSQSQPLASPLMNTKVSVNFDSIKSQVVEVTVAGKTDTMETSELLERLKTPSDEISMLKTEIASLQEQLKRRPSVSVPANEDPLIKNMIDKARKINSKITMSLTLGIPPKEVYDTIKNVYDENMTEDFLTSLTARFHHDDLLKSISMGLREYYENHAQSVKNIKKEAPVE